MKSLLGTAAILTLALAASSAFANKDHKEMFKMMDGNNDGRITALEHETAGITKFTKADANRDGALTKGEFTTFMMDEKGKSASKSEKMSEKKIAKLDGNSDGVLTQQEYTDGMKKMYSDMDANKDGAISMEEMKDKH